MMTIKRTLLLSTSIGALLSGMALCPAHALAQGDAAAASVAAEPTLDVKRYRIDGDNPLSEAETEALLAPYVGERRTLDQIEQAAAVLERAYRTGGFSFHRVIVPVQKPVGGEIVLKIITFGLDQVTVSGNEHFSAENIRRSLPALRPGEAPDLRLLGRDLTAANANPAKQVAVTFREGVKPNSVDAAIAVKDTDPLTPFAGYTANRSVDPLHRGANLYRLSAGVQYANLFDRDHVGTFSYTTDPRDLGKVSLLGLYYQLPIYGTGLSLAGYYTKSDVNSGRVPQGAGFFDVSGRGEFAGLRLTQALPRIGTMQQTLSAAIDNRYFENNTRFNGTQVQPNVGSRPASLRYTLRQDEAWGGYGGNIEYAVNTGGGAADNGANHRANGGDFGWDAWRYGADFSLNNEGWNFAGKLRGQWTSHSLIAGEQFGLGGAGSVRGFADREVAGDYGFLWNVEVTAPQVLLPQLKPVLFTDGGQVHSKGTGQKENLLSVGAGLRWSYQQLDAALDLAHVLDRNNANPEEIRNRLHFSLFYRF